MLGAPSGTVVAVGLGLGVIVCALTLNANAPNKATTANMLKTIILDEYIRINISHPLPLWNLYLLFFKFVSLEG